MKKECDVRVSLLGAEKSPLAFPTTCAQWEAVRPDRCLAQTCAGPSHAGAVLSLFLILAA